MLRVRWLGRVPYEEAFDLQRALATRSREDYLLLLEHPHVYTLGVRARPSHVLVDPERVGAALIRSNRGGDVTYHGPGQLVIYPIVTVTADPSSGREHVARLEQVLIDALTGLGVDRSAGGLGRLEGFPGVWVGLSDGRPRKLASIGVRTIRTADRRRRTLHGAALNIDCDLSMFRHIVPCGITEYPVTSLANEGLGIGLRDAMDAIVERASREWGAANAPIDRQGVASARLRLGVRVRGEARSDDQGPGLQPLRDPGPAGASPDRGACGDGRQPGSPGPVYDRPLTRRLRQAGVDPDQGLSMADRKPPWLRVPARMGGEFLHLGGTLHALNLVTVCEEAGCPNIFECWNDGTATFMVNGSRCTRACGFCKVDTRRPFPLDPTEPERVARAVEQMGLAHAVVTCVARDDLPDGGAGAIAATIRAIRERCPSTTVETLVSDCKGDPETLATIFEARPDVLNHNIETVARLQRAVRPSAGYSRSLAVLARAADAGLVVKSGLMVGLGEERDEVLGTLADLRGVGVSIATIGQYIRPSRDHIPVARWWSPEEFTDLREEGLRLGFTHVQASPLTRSSYHAREAAEASGQLRWATCSVQRVPSQ